MIIDLPKTFRFISTRTDYAEVKDGVLHLYGNVSFRKVIYNVTFTLKGNKQCYYCGVSVKPKNITLDHMYAKYVGGPTIPNNLLPCCPDCNSKKSNLSAEQFNRYLKLPEDDAEAYRQLVISEQDLLKSKGISELPKEWITKSNPNNFIVRIYLGKGNKSRSYGRIAADYKRYHNIINPIIVDKNNFVLDGYTTLLFAKDNGLKSVPVIVLENVVAHF